MAAKSLKINVLSLILLTSLMFYSSLFANDNNIEKYIVKQGDNLWLISEKFFKDPFKWLELWKINPDIKDPHWIYPGSSLLLQVREKEENRLVQKEEKPVITEEKVEEEKPQELVIEEGQPKEVDIVKEVKPKFKKYVVDVSNIDRLAFFLEEKLADFFTIISSEEKSRFGTQNAKYVVDGGEIKGLKKDEILLVLKPYRTVFDEKNNKVIGYYYEKLGIAKVEEVYPQTAQVKVIKSYAEIEAGDILCYEKEHDNPEVTIKRSGIFLQGNIIEIQGGLFFAGDKNFVFIDKGTKDGLERGDLLKIEKQIDEYSEKYIDTGKMVIIKTWDGVSAAYVLELTDAVTKGSRFSTLVGNY